MQQIGSLLWYMRGGLTREEAWTLSPIERREMFKQIEDRVKLTEKSGMALL